MDLVVEAEGGRPRDRNLGLAASRFVQPIGTCRGMVLGEAVGRLAGVLEDHAARWQGRRQPCRSRARRASYSAATPRNPIGHATPVPWSGQYPPGFLERYCWW